MTQIDYPQAAPQSSDPLGQFLQPARNFVCELWRDHPGWIAPTGGIAQVPMQLLMQRVCPPPLPNPPSSPVPLMGGQCATNYFVTYRTVLRYPSGSGFDTTQELPAALKGAILGIKTVDKPSTQAGQTDRDTYIVYDGGVGERLVQQYSSVNGATAQTTYISSRRADAQADTCGDNFPQYPPTIPPANRITNNINFNIGGTNVLLPVAIIPVIVNPTLAINPQLDVNVGGINLSFNLGGINVDVSSPNTNPITLPGSPDPRTNPPLPHYPTPTQPQPHTTPPAGGSGGCPDVDITPVLNVVNSIKSDTTELLDCDRCALPSPSPINYTEVVLGSGGSGVFTLPLPCLFVRFDLTTVPGNAKKQAGVNAPDVVYAGWFSFKSFNGQGERRPLHYTANTHPVPDGSTAITFTCYTGITANVTAIKKA